MAIKGKKRNRIKKDPKLPKLLGNKLGGVYGALHEIDYKILALVCILSVFGVLMVYSASYYQVYGDRASGPFSFMERQIFFVLTGMVLLCIAMCTDYHWYAKVGKIALAVSIIFLVLVLLVGRSTNGAQRWIGIGPINITPSEFSKVLMIIFTSVYLAEDPSRIKGKGLFTIYGIMLLHAALIYAQPNLSTAILLCLLMMGILFVAGLSWRWVGGMIGLAIGAYLFLITFMKDTYWYTRIMSFRDPFADAQGSGYQVVQSLIALGNGGLRGVGLGNSIGKNLYIPEPQTDFIMSIIGEELGYIGFLALMFIYILLFFFIILTAAKAKDILGLYIASGVAIMLGLQVIMNVAVVTGSMPPTGVTLPFISYGGSSIWVFMYAMGMALNVSRSTRKRKAISK